MRFLDEAELVNIYVPDDLIDSPVVLLQGADLSGADLRGASLPGAELSGVDLTGATRCRCPSRWLTCAWKVACRRIRCCCSSRRQACWS
jgi:uncharacterized protein YjbI with pentapeptide repeats